MEYDVIGIGYSAIDFLGIVSSYPPLDAKTEMQDVTIQGGGVTATAMVAVARLGGRASYIGSVGDDIFGKLAIVELGKENVDTSRVIIRPGCISPFAVIVIDRPTGKRNIFWSRSDVPSIQTEELDRDHILSTRVLHVDNHEPAAAIEAAKWANNAGIPVLMDVGSMRPGVPELMEYVDVLITSRRFAEEYCGTNDPAEAAMCMLVGRRRISVVTSGEDGCVCVTPDEVLHVPAFKVDVVDTTGAGDVFHGAFSFALAKEWSVKSAVIFASAASAIKCTKLGGRLGIPTFEETLSFLRDRGHGIE